MTTAVGEGATAVQLVHATSPARKSASPGRSPRRADVAESPARDFDLVVVGSGPAGQKAAIQGAKLRRRVALIERRREVGGASVNTGTIPSKTIREAILYLTGMSQRSIYGAGYRLKDEISVEDLATRTRYVVERERAVIRDQLLRNHVVLIEGTASFEDEHTLRVADAAGRRGM